MGEPVQRTVDRQDRGGASTAPSASPATDDDLDAAYDVVIVGGGAAGLGGALVLGRARRKVLVIDAGDPRNAPAGHVHNYLTSEGVTPSALLAAGRAEVAGYGVRVVSGTVTAARRLTGGGGPKALDGAAVPDGTGAALAGADGSRFGVDLADGRSVRSRRLLVTTGLADELPEVPGVAERWGRDVLHCPYCHGWEVRDQAIGILGTGPMAVHGALLFRQLSDDVVLFQHTSPTPSEEQAEQLAARGITVVTGEVASVEVDDDRLTGVRLRTGEFVARQAVVVTPRVMARAEVLETLGLKTADFEMGGHVLGSYVPADPTGATEVAGVWVAGNVADPLAQVITSAGAGLKVGAAVNADLIAEDTARAVAAHRTRVAAADR